MAASGQIDFQSLVLQTCPTADNNDPAAWLSHFQKLANFVLLECVLVVSQKYRYKINEIEFYYKGDPHPDCFTHAQPLQRTCGQWYFHRQGATYRSGTFKGLDLTFNMPHSDHAGGILFRGFVPVDKVGKGADAEKKAATQGCCLLVQEILAKSGADTIATFVDSHLNGNLSATDPSSALYIERDPAGAKSWRVYQSSRVGLFLKPKEAPMAEQEKYVCRPYRFVTLPHTISKGRGLLFAWMAQTYGLAEAESKLSGTRALMMKYAKAYEEALKAKESEAKLAAMLSSLKNKSLDESEALQLFVILN